MFPGIRCILGRSLDLQGACVVDRYPDGDAAARIKYRIEIRSGIMVKISISRCVYRRIQPRDASFWANFCGVFYSNNHVADYMQLHMVTAERFFEFLSGILFAPPNNG